MGVLEQIGKREACEAMTLATDSPAHCLTQEAKAILRRLREVAGRSSLRHLTTHRARLAAAWKKQRFFWKFSN